jgi:adhesin/invasin
VTPSVPAGTAASTTTLSYTDNTVTVTVGGIVAGVAFAGLAPGYVGLYQVNAIVPTGVATGPSVPVIVTAAGAASAPVTVAIR